MLKKIRVTLAILCYALVTLLFLDFTGTLQGYFGFLAKVQFLPAVFALNVVAILFVVVLTLLFGRIYCSVICPLGVFQDIFSWLGGKRKKTKHGRFKFVKERRIPRYAILGLFIVGLATSFPAAILIAPYSAYGRIATYILSPIYKLANNGLAYMAERMDSYLFYSVEVWNKGLVALVVAIATFVILGVFAYFKGRAYCNTICPVGTFLGFISRFAIFRPVIDKSKCIHCGMCERNCKSSCIDSKEGAFDYSRCVSCMNCIDKCSKKAISYKCRFGESTGASTTKTETLSTENVDSSRRKFLGIATVLAAGTIAHVRAQDKVDEGEGGLAPIKDKVIPERFSPIAPPGAKSVKNLQDHCTGCGLCISACPNDVLRPGKDLKPVVSYERGYCRPECNRCSSICPTGAINKISLAEKSSTQVGHAVWQFDLCIVTKDGVECGNCARHCPTGAIQMVSPDPNDPTKRAVPVVNTERCIGCGACENLCPARPLSAIYVEGHEAHRKI